MSIFEEYGTFKSMNVFFVGSVLGDGAVAGNGMFTYIQLT